jgi:hypoxanthine-DNA glycosylase
MTVYWISRRPEIWLLAARTPLQLIDSYRTLIIVRKTRQPPMAEIYSFPPIIAPDARVLILGSMPGEMSLSMQQYYAHRHNAFWKILGDLLGSDQQLDYPSRTELLRSHGIGLWDVLMSCQRQGSLDSAIDAATMVPNDFLGFYEAHPGITHVFFNGGTAAQVYKRHVLPKLGMKHVHLKYEQLPSTSPAHASLNYEQKLQAWGRILTPLTNGYLKKD